MKIRVVSIHKNRRGVALLYAVSSAFVAAGMVTLMLGVALASDKTADVQSDAAQADFLAAGALEAAKKSVQSSIANWTAIPSTGTIDIDGHTATYVVRETGFNRTSQDPVGIQSIETGYEIRAESQFGAHASQAYRIVNARSTPLLQFAVFYNDDLEIAPGPNMTIAGRVHSNRNMHLSPDATLRLNTNYVHAVGNLYRNRKDDPTRSPGTVLIREFVTNPWNATEPVGYATMWSKAQLQALGPASIGGYDSNFTTGYDHNGNGVWTDTGDILPFGLGALAYWDAPTGYTGGSGSTVQTGQHGISESVVPQSGSIAMYEPTTGGNYNWNSATQSYVPVAAGTGTHSQGFYHDNADLKVIVNAAGTSFKCYNGAGTDITTLVGSAVTLSRIYDARQANGGAGNTKTVQIDIGLLHASGQFPANGLLYAAHYGAGTGTTAKGVVLKNGALLPAKLTVASEDPVYIQGDYNVGSGTVTQKGAAVVCDAINLLSNSWTGTKTNTSGLPNATATTYNVAMIAGNMPSSVGHYNGGLENLPRFHENWSNINCTIKGAMVNTWRSEHATAAWVYGGNRYTAPNRLWSYNTAFNTVANLPPFTPMAVEAIDVVTW